MRLTEWEARRRTVGMTHGDGTYVEVGSGPPVVLLHGVGFAQGAHDWFLAVDALAENFRVLALDLVGWGPGARLTQAYSFARLVDFVREFQDRLDLPSTSVVGHSMGGWVASLLAYESPERVDRLVLVGSGGMATRPLPMMTEFAPPTLAEVESGLAARSDAPAEEVAAWAEYGWRNVQTAEALDNYRRLLAHMTEPENRALYNVRRRLPLVPAETLVVWGEDDAINDVSLGRETAELLPRATLTTLPCGHFPHTERPAEFTRSVGAFLAGDPAVGE
jgi:pimeloyl-ACP methyl ester carboxylesterase